MSQAALGAALGLTQGNISQWEEGTIDISTSYIPELSRILQVPESEFFSGKQPKVEQSIESLRLSCIAAILKAKPGQLTLLRETFPNLFNPAADETKDSSAV